MDNSKKEEPQGFKFKYCLYLAAAIMVILALVSHQASDFSVLQGGSERAIRNWIGIVGAHISCTLLLLFGMAAYPLTAFLIICAARPAIHFPVRRKGYFGALLVICFGTTILFGMYPEEFCRYTDMLGIGAKSAPGAALSGGVIGQQLAAPKYGTVEAGIIRYYIGAVGTMVMALVFLAVGLFFVWRADWHRLFMAALIKTGEAAAETPSLLESAKAVIDKLPRRAAEAEPEAVALPVKPIPAATAVPLSPPPKPEPVILPPEAEEETREEPPLEVHREGSLLQRLLQRRSSDREPESGSRETKVDSGNESLSLYQRLKLSAEESGGTAPAPESEEASVLSPHKNSVAAPIIVARETVPEPEDDDTPATALPPRRKPVAVHKRVPAAEGGAVEYVLPPVAMLSRGAETPGESAETLKRNSEILQETLESFKVDGQVTGIVSGPRVTRYEVTLAPGVKVEKVANIANNIAMQLEAESIRVLAPIPGRNAVGVEAPNALAAAVYLRGLMESPQWRETRCQIPIVLGKDVAGLPVVMDLAKAPHLLIAGATGSGKSVCMNTLIMSLLFRFRPDELRLIMVDPKVVEMEMYTPLPHLITPVVNDPQKVPIALRWAVNEMEKRYRILAKARVRNLSGYNTRAIGAEVVLDDNGDPIPDKMPVLVIIVDELADVMMTDAKSDVETSIARIAQKGRAAGIHIVIATQRPSTNIITGVIKANLPTRIAFRVGSIVDSRVILDQKGAETLLGRGDMLFVPPGSANLDRIQGAMVEDADIQKVVDFVSAQAEQSFDDKVVSAVDAEVAEGADTAFDDDGDDTDDGGDIHDAPDIDPVVKKYLQPEDGELVRKALEIALLERKVSTSYLQRRLGIGYNRAAEIVDRLEERGIVSAPLPGGSKREILVFDEIDNA
ncbi:MAG: DNA translocase FtsK [Victivallales bacterium]|nr:DNA translocase FtsK [Victivallales bacterium]